MKRTYLSSIIFLSLIVFFMNVESYSQEVAQKPTAKEKAINWVKSGIWAKGLKMKPHYSVDAVQFKAQYTKNKAWWDKAFDFLRNTDLEALKPGKTELEGENVYVSVTEGPTKEFTNTKWEAHQKYIDIQYVIKGEEKMGKAPFTTAKPVGEFDTVKDLGFYTIDPKKARFYTARPGKFFIFFPSDAHRPGIKVKGCDNDKKLVVKIKVS